jgi:hypothetical protein
MSGGKGGKQTTEVQIPQYLEDAVKENIARGSDVAKLGYTPYYGPDVAAMTPMQTAAAQNINQGASAFGLAAPSDPMAGMPTAETFAGGVQGYSSGPIYDESLQRLKQERPGQYDAMTGMFIDPQTGLSSYTPGTLGTGSMGSGKGGAMQESSAPVVSSGGRDRDSNRRMDRQTAARSGNSGGFTSVRDMFDGGGPGQSGDSYQGGGVVSRVGNVVTGSRPSRNAPASKPTVKPTKPAPRSSSSSAPRTVTTKPRARPTSNSSFIGSKRGGR